jgi:hypothetical protein
LPGLSKGKTEEQELPVRLRVASLAIPIPDHDHAKTTTLALTKQNAPYIAQHSQSQRPQQPTFFWLSFVLCISICFCFICISLFNYTLYYNC